jgi:FtsZ-interacting cell division protein ZipA
MSAELSILIVVIAVAFAGLLVFLLMRNKERESQRLHERFGSEYEREVGLAGHKRDAERDLSEREKRVERLHLKELEPDKRLEFSESWRIVQARFVDDPTAATKDAQGLVEKVMDARGYPVTGFEQQAGDISVDHPEVVKNYRAAHSISLINEKGEASTEDLRQAMVHYRSLFAELLGATPAMR